MSIATYPYFPHNQMMLELYYLKMGVSALDYIEWIPRRITELRTEKGVSARDMSLSLGQSVSYINKIENGRTLPSMTGFLYICDYFGITPQEFFNVGSASPQRANELLAEIEKLPADQSAHILEVVKDLNRLQG